MSSNRNAHDDLVLAEAVLLGDLPGLDQPALLRLAEHGRQLHQPPAFHGRCLEPAYLDAVARGAWSADDESRLTLLLQRAESETVRRVPRRYRRGLRIALHATALSLVTRQLPVGHWQERRLALAGAWERAVGPLPAALV